MNHNGDTIQEETVANLNDTNKNKPLRKHRRTIRWCIAVAAFLVCVFAVIPAIAVRTQVGYRLFSMVMPTAAQFYKPIQTSCESNGLRMEAVSAQVHGDTAEIVISMQDLNENRVDASMDLFDSYDIVIPRFESQGTCNQIGYDGATKTATFRAIISTMDGTPIPDGKVTFSVRCFLSRKQIAEDVPLTMDWSVVDDNPATLPLITTEGGYTYTDNDGKEAITPIYTQVLKPSAVLATLFDGFTVTGMGYIDGRLHLQLHTPGRSAFDDHAFLELRNTKGRIVNADMVYHLSVDLQEYAAETSSDYIDYVFDVSQAELMNYSLYGSFYAAKSRTDGYWEVTLPIASESN